LRRVNSALSIDSPREKVPRKKRERKPKTAEESNKKVFEFDPDSLPKAVDVVFCCDATGSMSSYIDGAKNTIERMMEETIERFKGIEVKFGFVAYRDHKDKVLLEVKDLADSEEVINFMDKIDAKGGGDAAEAVHDGLNAAITKMSWRDGDNRRIRMIFHITDAPPHGKEYWPQSHFSDDYPDGCPCGIKLCQIAEKVNELGIRYVLMKIGKDCEKMRVLFQQSFENVNETTAQIETRASRGDGEIKGEMGFEDEEGHTSPKGLFRAYSICDANDLEDRAMDFFEEKIADFAKE